MAAYFEFTDINREEFQTHIGTSLPFSPYDISAVQLDGDELEYVRNTMDNIPMHKTKRVVRIFGDHAKFIAANWF